MTFWKSLTCTEKYWLIWQKKYCSVPHIRKSYIENDNFWISKVFSAMKFVLIQSRFCPKKVCSHIKYAQCIENIYCAYCANAWFALIKTMPCFPGINLGRKRVCLNGAHLLSSKAFLYQKLSLYTYNKGPRYFMISKVFQNWWVFRGVITKENRWGKANGWA